MAMTVYSKIDQRVLTCFDMDFNEGAIVSFVRGLEESKHPSVVSKRRQFKIEDEWQREYGKRLIFAWIDQHTMRESLPSTKMKSHQTSLNRINALIEKGVLIRQTVRLYDAPELKSRVRKGFITATYLRTTEAYREVEQYFKDRGVKETSYDPT